MRNQNPNLKTAYQQIRPETRLPYTLIYLVRHCAPDYQVGHETGDKFMPLSKVGLQQRALLNKKFEDIKPDKIYASELVRAQQTVGEYADKFNKKVFIDYRLNEVHWDKWYRMKYFNMSEKTRVKRFRHYRELNKRLEKMQADARRTIASLYEENKGKKVVLVCHGNIIRSMITGILNTDVIGFLSMEIYQSSVTKLVIDRDGYIKINYINNIWHLPKRPEEDIFKMAIEE